MAFNGDKPAHGTTAKSAEVRANFLALVTHHRSTAAPAGAQTGWIWWDSATPTNEKLKAYYDGSWVTLLEHMESAPVPAVLSGVNMKSGATQVAAGADEDELWSTVSHATLPDGVVMRGL